jgi:nicotinate-nucleotide adenylyltransferase
VKRIGLLGGTFDPVHNAHLALARQAMAELALDQVRWIPAGNPWQKSRAISDALHREAMLGLALEGEPRFVIDRSELGRAGPSYTADTVRELQRGQPDAQWFLLIGADQYAGLHTWHRWRELLARVTLAVAARPGDRGAAHPEVAAAARCTLALPKLDISSTGVRKRVAAGADIGMLVPPAVASYIARHQLYEDHERPPGN